MLETSTSKTADFRWLKTLALVCSITSAASAFAFYSTVDDGYILKEGQYRVTGTGQMITSEGAGGNATGRFTHPWNDEIQIEALAGFGDVDFQAGAFAKWVPIPDYENQPAIGVKIGALYGTVESLSEVSFRVHPLISKAFESDIGTFTPYGSIPIGMRFYDSKIDIPTQLVAGSFYKHPELSSVSFALELGFELNKAFNYVTLGVVLDIDEAEGVTFR
ncbi:MAG: hypothetical protein HRT45_07670 [Bdellovibrionales bacterium]|nr:hypothetical protein [Bdellovibrionales bacterium]